MTPAGALPPTLDSTIMLVAQTPHHQLVLHQHRYGGRQDDRLFTRKIGGVNRRHCGEGFCAFLRSRLHDEVKILSRTALGRPNLINTRDQAIIWCARSWVSISEVSSNERTRAV